MKKLIVMLAFPLMSTGFAFAVNMSLSSFAEKNKEAAIGLSTQLEEMQASAEAEAANEPVPPFVLNKCPVQKITLVVKKKSGYKITKKTFECPGVIINDNWLVVSKYCGIKFMGETSARVSKKPKTFSEYTGYILQPQYREYHREKITYEVAYYINHSSQTTKFALAKSPSTGDYYSDVAKKHIPILTSKAKVREELGELVFLNFGKGAFAKAQKAGIILRDSAKLSMGTDLKVYKEPISPSSQKIHRWLSLPHGYITYSNGKRYPKLTVFGEECKLIAINSNDDSWNTKYSYSEISSKCTKDGFVLANSPAKQGSPVLTEHDNIFDFQTKEENYGNPLNPEWLKRGYIVMGNYLVGFAVDKQTVNYIPRKIENHIKSIAGDIKFFYLP